MRCIVVLRAASTLAEVAAALNFTTPLHTLQYVYTGMTATECKHVLLYLSICHMVYLQMWFVVAAMQTVLLFLLMLQASPPSCKAPQLLKYERVHDHRFFPTVTLLLVVSAVAIIVMKSSREISAPGSV